MTHTANYLFFPIRRHKSVLIGALFLVALFMLGAFRVARADVVIGGCTIVSNPTVARFTNCPNANLANANLSNIGDLSFANLSGANLNNANLFEVAFDQANLSGANLSNTNLSGGSLTHANLTNANLTGADLIDADFSAATLSGVTWNNTICPNATNSNSHGNTCVGHLLLPTITASAKKADNTPYSAGSWTTQNVTVHFTCTPAAGRTIESCPADQAYTSAGSFTANGTTVDTDGYFSDLSFGPIQIDRTAPNITASATKADNTPYTAGTWANQNVTVHFTCSDNASGLAGPCPADQVVSAEGVTAPIGGAITDQAGNPANTSFGPIQLDKSKPTITGSRSPGAGNGGWNDGDVTVSFTCVDNQNGAGLATNTVAGATVSSEGANQTVTNSGTCIDKAGNAASTATVDQINIDKSAPETTITRQPDDPSPLVATFEMNGADALSGVAGFACSLDGAAFTACTTPQAYPSLTAGQHTFQVRAIDVAGHVDGTPASYTWTASGNLPIAADQTLTVVEDGTLAITLSATGQGTLTYTIIDSPAHGVLADTAPTLVYTPAANFNGTDSFTFRVNNGQFNSNLAKITIAVTPVDDPLVINQAPLTVTEDLPLAITLGVLDVDGDALTYALLSPPTHGTLAGSLPNVVYTPAANFSGTDRFVFSVSDSPARHTQQAWAGLITGTVQIAVSAVNDVPVATNQTVATLPDTALPLLLHATDAENDPLSYTITVSPQHGTVSGSAPNLTYTPAANFVGDDQLSFTVSDGQATSPVATIVIRVTTTPFTSLLPLVGR